MTRQKSKFWNFVFSLVPGCGQMHLGFMKRGVTLLLLFGASIALSSMMYMSIFAVPAIACWFYAFFDSLNLNSMDPAVFVTIPDNYLLFDTVVDKRPLQKKLARILGFALILVGIVALWSSLRWTVFEHFPRVYDTLYVIFDMLPSILLAAACVWGGVYLITRKKKEVQQPDELFTE